LQLLAKRAEKLVRLHMAAAAFGDNPSKLVNEDMLSRR
jgi:hypothetical protein